MHKTPHFFTWKSQHAPRVLRPSLNPLLFFGRLALCAHETNNFLLLLILLLLTGRKMGGVAITYVFGVGKYF